jgi:hypothetical protein
MNRLDFMIILVYILPLNVIHIYLYDSRGQKTTMLVFFQKDISLLRSGIGACQEKFVQLGFFL